MPQPLIIILVEKLGELKSLSVKDYKEDELFKKCGFKKADDFSKQVDWPVKIDGQKYIVSMFGKSEGKANMENKYDFPPPIDNNLYFGSCALVGIIKDNTNSNINLSVDLWNKIYEKLFGGFENLLVTCNEDDEEEDELKNIPKNMKTKKGGYLKDGFVVDSSDAEEEEGSSSEEDEDVSDAPSLYEEELLLEDLGSELSEESYIE